MLEIKNISKKFGDITALEDISFEVGDGEFIFLCGPSGAGKTTLLKLILREVLPTSGEILLDGKDITKLPKKEIPKLRQNIGVVFQDFKVLNESTVRENIEVALAVIGLPRQEWKARVNHVLKLVGLSERSELFPNQLSGGELQRVSLARALVVNPKIILADEPTGNLDWTTSDKLMDLFEKIQEEGKTIIMATHNQLVLDKMKKRVVQLDKGKVVRENHKKK
jgi:cell division transport system ATP-binding protein